MPTYLSRHADLPDPLMFAPLGDAQWAAFYPQVTLAALAHPRLSMVGPLRGPRRMEVKREKLKVKNGDSARGANEKRKEKNEKRR